MSHPAMRQVYFPKVIREYVSSVSLPDAVSGMPEGSTLPTSQQLVNQDSDIADGDTVVPIDIGINLTIEVMAQQTIDQNSNITD